MWLAQFFAPVALGGYTCDTIAAGQCLSGCFYQPKRADWPRNRCTCNYEGGLCNDHEWCSCFSVPAGRCMTGCNPQWTLHSNRCNCNYDNTPCNDWECTLPPVTDIKLDLNQLFECDGSSGSHLNYDFEVKVGRRSSTAASRSTERSHTSTVSVTASIGDDAAKMSFSKEQQDFVKSVSSFAESSEFDSETTEKWTIFIDCHTEQHLYQGQVTYVFADGTSTVLSSQGYHLKNKALPSLQLHGSVVPSMRNASSVLV